MTTGSSNGKSPTPILDGRAVAAARLPGIRARAAAVASIRYFNPRGPGDVHVSGGIDHLGALAPVPGGVGPMTVSMLTEAVVARAERTTPAP